MIKKTVQRSEDCFVQFTDEELQQLGIKAGDKSSSIIENNSVIHKKFETIDIDLSELSRDILEMIIADSVEKDISVNEVIGNILEKSLSLLELNDGQ